MLRPPYRRYSRLYVYHLGLTAPPEIDDPDWIGAWQEGETIVLFFHRPKDELVRALCARHGCELVYQADLDYADWEAGVEPAPFTVGGLRIAPVWDQGEADLRLDPSVIFGSGFHPSTRLCLEAVCAYFAARPAHAAPATVLDLGCGTGVLSLAAAFLGAGQVTAHDYNGLACEVTRANARRNGLDGRVTCRRTDLLTSPPATAGIDLVMANLHHELLLDLFARPTFWQAGHYLLSGFFPAREEALLAALPVPSPRFVARRSSGKWALWVLDRSTS